jgi:hypothetical protein
MSDSLPAKAAENSADLTFLARKPSFLECDDAAAFLHGMKFKENTEDLWFILKDCQGRYYCAEFLQSDAREVNNDSVPSNDLLFVSKCAGQLCVSVGYTVVASFHLHPGAWIGLEETEAELSYRNRFFSWSDLWAVMNPRRQYSRCYLSTGKDGLISYASSASDFESELSRQIAKKTDQSSSLFQRLYERGTFPASIWILLAIGAGELRMVVNSLAKSALWRRRGALNASWKWDIDPNNQTKKFSVELMPIFSPVFHDVAGVASYWRIRQPNSSEGQTVGVILKHKHRDEFIATAAEFGDYIDFDVSTIFPKDQHGNVQLPEGFRVYGFYHSSKPSSPNLLPAADTERFKNFFSPSDMKVGLDRLVAAPQHHLFMITPDGAVLSFSQPDIPVRSLIVELTTDFERKLVSGEITTQMYVDKVAAAGNLSVLVPSKTWPDAGRIRPSAETVALIADPAE